jgi:hypothetical protein
MRKILAVLLAGLFLILFFVATTVNQVVDTASDPDVITGMLNDSDAYDYAYDNIVGNLVHDIVDKGIEIDSGLDDSSPQTVLRFEDPDAAALAITNLIETLVPREYVKDKLEESLNGVVPYARGETDEFTIDLEVQERVRTVPAAARQVVADLDLTERVIEDLLLPQLDQFTEQISGQALGIELTSSELDNAAREVFEPEWLEAQLFGAIDELTPFFAGDSDSFNVVLKFDDRAVIIGRILKDKLVSESTLYNLVFAQVVDPLIQQTVAQSTSVGFGIALTESEVIDTFELIAPRAWVEDQGEGVIDALIDYLVGNSDSLAYTVDLSDRKTAAISTLQILAREKLSSTLGEIPACSSPADALGASQDLSAQQLPRCITGGQPMIDLALTSFGPVMDQQVASFVEAQVPNEVSYSQDQLAAHAGGGLDTLEDLRSRISEGVNFTDRDLVNAMSDGSRQSQADAEEALRILANGVMITEENITDNLDPLALQQFNRVRDLAGTALGIRWILWVVVLIPLFVIALIGGRGWPGRLKWAGGVALVSALIVYGGIAVAWSFNDIANDYVPDYGAEVSNEFRADYPRLSAELESDELNNRFERAVDSWQQSWRNQTLPWIIGGAVVFAAGIALSTLGTKKGTPMGGGTAYAGAKPTESTAFSVPKEWGDDAEEDRQDSKIEAEKPETLDEEKESGGGATV